jgi:ABC-type nitrate/sulfonate/bicarbonate transport system ATPase subunit
MLRKLTTTGNSTALLLTRDMKEHLGISDTIEVIFEEGQIILRKPMTFEEAKALSHQRYAEAYRELAK